MSTPSKNNVINLCGQTQLLPTHIDSQLHQMIQSYLSKRGHTYATLARDIDDFVRAQYKEAWHLVEYGEITQHELEKHIKDHIPSRSYLHDYAGGRPICFRYTNTIANFFDVKYRIYNFDPSQDLKEFLNLQAKSN